MFNSFIVVPDEDVELPSSNFDWEFDSLPSEWTHTRTTSALGRGVEGRWISYAANVLRPHYHPVDLNNLGALVEPARSQLFLTSRPATFTPIAATATDDAAIQTPFGLGVRNLIPTTALAAHGLDLFFGSTRAVSLADESRVSLRFVFKPIGTFTRGVMLCQTKAGTYNSLDFSTNNGGEILSSTMAWSTITQDTDGFFELQFSMNYGTGTVSTGSANFGFRTDAGERVFAGDGTSGIAIAYYGAELGTETTSPILSTAGANVFRAEDVLQSQTTWISTGPKTLGVEYTPLSDDVQVILQAVGNDTIELRTTPASVTVNLLSGGSSVGLLTGSAPARGVERTNVMTADFNEFWLMQDGERLAFSRAGYSPSSIDNIRIGARSTGGFSGPVILKRFKYWSQALSRTAAVTFSADLSIGGSSVVLPVLETQENKTVPATETTVSIAVALLGEPSGASVAYATTDGTAIAGTDYTSTTGRLEFSPGQSIAEIVVPLGTRSLTQTRTFSLVLSSPVGATIGVGTCVVSLTKSTPTAHAPDEFVEFDESPLPAEFVVTRDTAGYAKNSSGVWTSIASGLPRIHYTGVGEVGILLEPPGEQCMFDSVTPFYLANSTRTTDTTTVVPTGTRSSVWRETTATAGHLLRGSWTSTSATWPTGNFVIWAMLKPVGARTVYRFSCKALDNVWRQVRIDMSGTGSVVAQDTGVVALIEPEPMWPGWYRVGMARGQGAATVSNAEFDMGPVDANNSNVLPGNTSNGFDLCHFQVEAGTVWSSPIPVQSQSAKTLRSGDILKAEGTWHKRQAFAIGVKFQRLPTGLSEQRVVQFRDAPTSMDDYGILISSGNIRSSLTTGGTFHGNITDGANAVGETATAVLTINTSRYALFANGTLAGQISMAGKTLPRTVETMRFGSKEQDGSQQGPIVIYGMAYWNLGLTDEEGTVFSADLAGVPPGEEEPEGPPVVSIPTTLTVLEGQSIDIVLTKVGVGACSVSFTTRAQTATFGQDYNGIGPITVSFAENENSKTLTVSTINDGAVYDPGETFGIIISQPVGCTLGNAIGVVTITEPPREPDEQTIYSRAVGFASQVNCGEGKPWYRVTTTADSGPGSLRAAVSGSNRNIIFEVGGTFAMNSEILTAGANNITVNGETAPYPGVMIQNAELKIVGSFQRWSHITIERGHISSDYAVDNGDTVKINPGSAADNWTRSHVHMSHCLFLWNQDEGVQLYPMKTCNLSDISLHDCCIAEPLYKPQNLGYRPHTKISRGIQTQHNYGMIIGYRTKRVDVQNSIFADCDMREPFIDWGTSVVLANNIAFNTTKGATIQHNAGQNQPMLVTCRGYLCISGPNSTRHSGFRFHTYPNPLYPGTRVFVDGLYGWKGGASNSTYITPGNSIEIGSPGTPYCNEGGARVNVITSTPPVNIPGAPVSPRSAQDIYDRAVKNCGPRPKERYSHSARVFGKLASKQTRWVNHESEVGGKTRPIRTNRALDGTTTFSDGATIPAPPDHTNVAAVKAWLELFRTRIQYD